MRDPCRKERPLVLRTFAPGTSSDPPRAWSTLSPCDGLAALARQVGNRSLDQRWPVVACDLMSSGVSCSDGSRGDRSRQCTSTQGNPHCSHTRPINHPRQRHVDDETPVIRRQQSPPQLRPPHLASRLAVYDVVLELLERRNITQYHSGSGLGRSRCPAPARPQAPVHRCPSVPRTISSRLPVVTTASTSPFASASSDGAVRSGSHSQSSRARGGGAPRCSVAARAYVWLNGPGGFRPRPRRLRI